MKMTWLHMEFVLIFSAAKGRALWHLCQPKCLLMLASLILLIWEIILCLEKGQVKIQVRMKPDIFLRFS